VSLFTLFAALALHQLGKLARLSAFRFCPVTWLLVIDGVSVSSPLVPFLVSGFSPKLKPLSHFLFKNHHATRRRYERSKAYIRRYCCRKN